MGRIPLVIGNWKMYKSTAETEEFINKFLSLINDLDGLEVGIAPPFTSLFIAQGLLKGKKVVLCAQNSHWEKEGAFTGEVSPYMLKELGVKYVIVGHSERRHIFGETNEMINKKVKAVLEWEMSPILCVGEKLDEREGGKTLDVVKRQLYEGLKDVERTDFVIAYEPVWAIGTGKTATPEVAEEVHEFIRNELKKIYGGDAEGVRILYGGSVKPENAGELVEMDEIDGLLVGGASLNPIQFYEIIKNVCEVYR